MSLICVGVIHGIESIELSERLKNELLHLAADCGIGVQFYGFEEENFLQDYIIRDDTLLFNIADNFIYINCEHLLRADWCNIEEEEEWGTLKERLEKIKMLLCCSLKYGVNAELLIGESGDLLSDFQLIHTSLDHMCDDIVSAYQEAKMEPCIHLIL